MGRTITYELLLVATVFVAVSVGAVQARTAGPVETARAVSPCADPDEPNLDPPVDWPTRYAVSQTGEINASFDAYGTFGLNLHPFSLDCVWPKASFETPPGSDREYLFSGAVWIGGIVNGDTLVTTGHDGWRGFREIVPSNGTKARTVTKLENMSDYSVRAASIDIIDQVVGGIVLDDRFKNPTPLNLRIVNQSHSWQTDPYDGAIIYDMVITNMGDELIEQGYVGIFIDADIRTPAKAGGHLDDLSGSVPERGLAYIIDNDGNPVDGVFSEEESFQKALAFKFLYSSFEATRASYNWWIPSDDVAHNIGPQMKSNPRIMCYGGIGQPVCDADKYFLMSRGEWDYDQVRIAGITDDDSVWHNPNGEIVQDDPVIHDGADTRFLMSIGPFDLPPDSSVRIQYTMFTADSIHTDPENFSNLSGGNYDPDAYLAGLNLERLYPIEQAAIEKGAALREAINPLTGLTLVSHDANSITLSWDPWVLGGLDGYDLFVTPIDPRDLPHQGLIPNWWRTDEPQFSNSIAVASQTTVEIPDSTIPYLVQARHRMGGETGLISTPLILNPYHRLEPPSFTREHLFADQSEMVSLEWSVAGEQIDHFNLYLVPAEHPPGIPYQPFYSFNRESGPSGPVDSIWTEGYWRYYFAMGAERQLNGDVTATEMQINEGDIMFLTSVDANGFESELSNPVECHLSPLRNTDILYLVTPWVSERPSTSQVTERMDTVLSGVGLTYDILVVDPREIDSIWNTSLHYSVLARYKWVLIDDGPNATYTSNWYDGLALFIQNGGRLASFSWEGLFTSSWGYNWRDFTWPSERGHDLANYFDIDSAFYADLMFYYTDLTDVDTICGFQSALSIDEQLASVSYDTSVYPTDYFWNFFWPKGTPAGVTVYAPGERSTTTHLFQSLYPEQSLMHGLPNGLKTVTEDEYGTHLTYTFGFHLHQMKVHEARDFVLALVDAPECCGRYTNGLTGNVDCDDEGRMDLVDIVRLIDRVYLSKRRLCCEKNGNVSGDPNGRINLVDLIVLIDHLYLSKNATAPCQ